MSSPCSVHSRSVAHSADALPPVSSATATGCARTRSERPPLPSAHVCQKLWEAQVPCLRVTSGCGACISVYHNPPHLKCQQHASLSGSHSLLDQCGTKCIITDSIQGHIAGPGCSSLPVQLAPSMLPMLSVYVVTILYHLRVAAQSTTVNSMRFLPVFFRGPATRC